MENQTDILDDNLENNTTFQINSTIINFLSEIAKWAKFLAIVGFVGLGILILLGLFLSTILSSVSTIYPTHSIGSSLISGMYIIMAAIYFFPILYLYRFSTRLKSAITSNNEQELEEAFKNLKAHYKFIGILAIILLAFYAFGILSFIIGSMAI